MVLPLEILQNTYGWCSQSVELRQLTVISLLLCRQLRVGGHKSLQHHREDLYDGLSLRFFGRRRLHGCEGPQAVAVR